MATAMASLFTGKPARGDLAMTGEIDVGSGPSDRWAEVEAARRASRRRQDRPHPQAEREGPGRRAGGGSRAEADRAGREHGPGAGRGAHRCAPSGGRHRGRAQGAPDLGCSGGARRPRSRRRGAADRGPGDGPADQPRRADQPDRLLAAMEYKDYYATLGVPKTASQADIKRPIASWPASSSRHEQGAGCGEALQGGERGAGRPDRSGEAAAVRRSSAPTGRPTEQAGFGSGGATDWAGFGGAPAARAGRIGHASTGGPERLQRLLPPVLRSREPVRDGPAARAVASSTSTSRSSAAPAAARLPAPHRTAARATAEVTLGEVASGAERMVNVNGRRLHVKIPAGRERRFQGEAQRRGRRWRPRHRREGQGRSAIQHATEPTCTPRSS